MFFFGSKKQRKESDNVIKKAEDIQEGAQVKVNIAKEEAEKLQRLVNRAAKNKDVTLTIFLGMGGDRRIK